MCEQCVDRPLFPHPLSRDTRLTAQRRAALDAGLHPVTGGPLHPDAPDDATPKDRMPRPHTCGTCAFFAASTTTVKTVYRCAHPGPEHALPLGTRWAIPRWWPACTDYRKDER